MPRATTNYKYVVVVIPPDQMEKTPSERETRFIRVDATTAKRAISKAEKLAADKAQWSRKDYEVLECYIDRDEETGRSVPALSWDMEEDDD